MLNFDDNILIQNIQTLMKSSNLTQQKLAEILGMSQSNVSKALSYTDKKCFTLDQVVGIAKYFNTSVDKLVGINRKINTEMTPRSIATFVVSLIESHKALFISQEIEEEQFIFHEGREADYENKKSEYLCIYLPNYWPAMAKTEDELSDIYSYYSLGGNETSMIPVNEFLDHFKEIFSIYEKGDLLEKSYRIIINDLLSHL